jgi:hypothetical protein
VWAGDQRQKLFRNLETVRGDIVLSAVTAPVAGELPWDESVCAGLGEHEHSGKLGCRVASAAAWAWNESAPDRWRRLHRRAYQDTVKRFGRGSVDHEQVGEDEWEERLFVTEKGLAFLEHWKFEDGEADEDGGL